jgi:hypothetical protein
MNSSANAAVSFSQASSPAELSDIELLAATRRLVGRSNQLLAALLEHLGEVEARGIHRTRACSGLYAYCIFELRLSEDEAYRRVAAARLVRRFPALLDAVASGELHLTGLLQLGPHFTIENLREVLARAKHRTKKEIARLVRVLDPLPEVPARIEPLGPASASLVPRTPTWTEFVGSMCPIRDLAPGERPRDWTAGTPEAGTPDAPAESAAPVESGSSVQSEAPGAPVQSAPASPARLEPQRYGVQFTANEEYVKLVEEAQALLSRSAPRATLDELHLRAMRALVAELKRQKYAVTDRPRKRSPHTSPPGASLMEAPALLEAPETSEASALAERSRPTAETGSPRKSPVPNRAGAEDTSRPPSVAPSPSATPGAARTPPLPGSAAVKLTAWSYITWPPSLTEASTPSRISRSAAALTTPSPPRRISAGISSNGREARTTTSRGW